MVKKASVVPAHDMVHLVHSGHQRNLLALCLLSNILVKNRKCKGST